MSFEETSKRDACFLTVRLVLALFAAVVAASGQTTELPPGLRNIRPPGLPDEAGWVLLVHESGGFSNASWTVVLDSMGGLDCSGLADRCDAAGPRALGSIAEAVSTVAPVGWSGALGPCSDCSSKMVILTVRAPEGQSVEHITYWNIGIPEPAMEALHLYEAVRRFLVLD
jgi:hypothetical protein